MIDLNSYAFNDIVINKIINKNFNIKFKLTIFLNDSSQDGGFLYLMYGGLNNGDDDEDDDDDEEDDDEEELERVLDD